MLAKIVNICLDTEVDLLSIGVIPVTNQMFVEDAKRNNVCRQLRRLYTKNRLNKDVVIKAIKYLRLDQEKHISFLFVCMPVKLNTEFKGLPGFCGTSFLMGGLYAQTDIELYKEVLELFGLQSIFVSNTVKTGSIPIAAQNHLITTLLSK